MLKFGEMHYLKVRGSLLKEVGFFCVIFEKYYLSKEYLCFFYKVFGKILT